MPSKTTYKGNRNLKKNSRKSSRKNSRKSSRKNSRKSTKGLNNFIKDLVSEVKDIPAQNNMMGNQMSQVNPMNQTNPMMNQQQFSQMMPQMMDPMLNPMLNSMGGQIVKPEHIDPLHVNYMVPVDQNKGFGNYGFGSDSMQGSQNSMLSQMSMGRETAPVQAQQTMQQSAEPMQQSAEPMQQSAEPMQEQALSAAPGTEAN